MTLKSILTSSVLVAALTAQVTREHSLVLKNWPVPLYWQPSPGESEASAGEKGLAPRATPAVALIFVAMTPCRVVDTRAGQMFAAPFGAPSLTPGPARSFPIQASTLCSIPANAQAYSFNVTVVPPGVLGYLTIFPHGQPQPNAVTLDDLLGTIVNNAAIVPAGTVNGSVDVVVNANTDLVLDINGYYALPNPTVNTANGLNALLSNTSGTDNTADGYGALFSNTTGNYNTASGALALDTNTIGSFNTATGYGALKSNTSGSFNVASGNSALSANTTGNLNVASGGYGALYSNTTGSYNIAIGSYSLFSNTTGTENTTIGDHALYNNATGNHNTSSGKDALYANTIGDGNTAIGQGALQTNTSGMFNIALGMDAGSNIDGNDNIDIADPGKSSENGVIRIGTTGLQKSFFAAGIFGVGTGSGNAGYVLVDQYGQLGTVNSSRRVKEDIQDMADSSSGLLRLRPVTFRYQRPYTDGSKPIDYGLIAEEVAEAYPDLVVKSSDGQIQSVQYQKLTPMLLNELQKQQTRITALEKALEALLAGRTGAPTNSDSLTFKP